MLVGDRLWMAVQREWNDDSNKRLKLVAFNPGTAELGAVHCQKADPAKGRVGR